MPSPTVIRVALSGATGKVGRGLAAAIDAADDLELVGQAAPSLGVSLTEVLQRGADVAIDFTVPDAAAAACETVDLGRRAAHPRDDAASRPPTSPATAITRPGAACQLFHAPTSPSARSS